MKWQFQIIELVSQLGKQTEYLKQAVKLTMIVFFFVHGKWFVAKKAEFIERMDSDAFGL